MHSETALCTNLVDWLKEQADLSFVFDRCARCYHVADTVVVSRHPVFSVWSQSARDIIRESNRGTGSGLSKLSRCLMFRKWNDLLSGDRCEVIERIDNLLCVWGYDDFQFLDIGGRALAFRTVHRPSGERRVLRVEAPHPFRQDRPLHPTVAIACQTLQGDELDGIKIEICDEFVPLNKIPDAKKFHSPLPPFYQFYGDIVELAWGTNMTYPQTLFDEDAEPQNVGLSPSGRVLSFDPQIIKGDEAMRLHWHFNDPYILRDASPQQLRLVYGYSPAFCL